MAKEWAAKLLFGLSFYHIFFILILTFATNVISENDLTVSGSVVSDVNLSNSFTQQSFCDYPRYKYNRDGEATRYLFDKDNLDCEISSGAFSQNVCNAIEGCVWNETSSGFLWFSETSFICEGTINKTFYNNGQNTTENICEVDGLQGDTNVKTCERLGCTSREPDLSAEGNIRSPSSALDVLGDLFTFQYDFGFDYYLYDVAVNFMFFYLPLIVLIIVIYLLSPFSN